ncbi:unnamed protein product [Phyllotreta striolata]|uniref:Uncharacterized protein n=1 Tax=Phyllotreta striolata TaxID=444603 RepID=A0A9N9XS76_PHYSR|nr:unnamed protein product [Phyllotreta striolata]
MGSSMSCVSTRPSQAVYDMTPVRNKNLPIIWIAGQPNTGKKTLGRLIKDRYEFEYINITELLRDEANKNTKKAHVINEAFKGKKKVTDPIVIDLLKESLLNSTNDKGFVITNFPKTQKQAERFIREIANVNFIFYFYSELPMLIERAQEKSGVTLDPETLRRDIAVATRDLKICLSRFTLKIESINTSSSPEETFVKVENALIRRINATPIKTETDYVQPQNSKIKHVPPPPPPLNYMDECGNKDKSLIVTPLKPEETKPEESKLSLKKETKPAGQLGELTKPSLSKLEKKDTKTADKSKDEEDEKKGKKKSVEILKPNGADQSVEDEESISLDS